MVMKNFCEMPVVRALLVALVVLFVWGAGVPEGALARVEMQNGHEGDPLDGSDIIGGGGGDSPGGSVIPPITKELKNDFLLNCSIRLSEGQMFIPTLVNGELVWIVLFVDLGRDCR